MESHTIFAALREALSALYPEGQDARVVVNDAGLNAHQIAFSSRAQTNWHNILAEALRQNRMVALLQVVLAAYGDNPAFRAAHDQYRHFIDHGGHIEPPAPLAVDLHIGALKIPKSVAAMLLAGFVIIVILIGLITSYVRGTFQAVTAPTPTATPTIPTSTPTMTPLPTATPLAFATQADGETLIVIATFHGKAAADHEPHTKIRRAIATEAAKQGEERLRVAEERTELTADQRAEAEALGKRYNASMVIWGEDTGVEVIVNFLNLREPDFSASDASVNTTEQGIQLANPDVYVRFITHDLPHEMGFFSFFAIGQSYYLNTQYPLAIERIEAAIGLVPSDAKPEGLTEAYFRLGWLYRVPTINNLDKAIAYYDKAIKLNPDFVHSYNNRGSARYNQGKLDEAIADFNKAIELNFDYEKAYYNRGLARYNQGKLDEAIADYDKAIELNPDYEKAYHNRGLAHYNQGKLDKAIADFDKAIELNHDYALAYNNRGSTHRVQGKLDEAIADFNKAIELNPDFAGAYYNRGLARYNQGKLDEAIANYNKAIELNPNFAFAYFGRGLARDDQGKLDEAIVDYDKAIELNPNFAFTYYNRGLARYNQGKLDEAIADYRSYLQLYPDAEDRTQVKQWIIKLEAELAKQK